MALRPSRLQTFLLGTLAGATLAFVVAIAAKRSGPPPSDPQVCPSAAAESAAPPTASAAEAPSGSAAAAAATNASAPADAPPSPAATLPLAFADPKRVDPQELVGRVKGLALSVERHAKLTHMVTTDLAQDGTVDLAAGGSIEFDFDYRYLGPAHAPVTGRVIVAVKQGGAAATVIATSADTAPPIEPLADPVCPLRNAWRQATKSGPPGAKAHAEYVRHPRTKGSVWMFLSQGAPAYERSVDGLNCALLDGVPQKGDGAAAPKRKSDGDPY